MSEITNGEIRDVIALALSKCPGVNIYKFPPEDISPPAAFVAGFSIRPLSFDGYRETSVDITVMVSHRHVDQLALLDAMLDSEGSSSIVAAIDNAASPDVNLRVNTIGNYREVIIADVPYYAADITVEVLT
jgi:hypothetical protein